MALSKPDLEVKSVTDELALLSVSGQEVELRAKVDLFPSTIRNVLTDLAPVSIQKAAATADGVDGRAGLANLVVVSQAAATLYQTSSVPYNPSDLPTNKLDAQLDAILNEFKDIKRAETVDEWQSFRPRGPRGTSGKLTTAYGITAGARIPQEQTPLALWMGIHDVDSTQAAYLIRDYDQHFNAYGDLDWLVASCALYVMVRTMSMKAGTISIDTREILNAATGIRDYDWTYYKTSAIDIALALAEADKIEFPSTGVPEDMKLIGQLQQVFLDIKANEDGIRYSDNAAAIRSASTLLTSLARTKRIFIKIWPFLVDTVQSTWQDEFERFIVKLEPKTVDTYLPWLSASTSTQLGDVDWLRVWLQARDVPADALVLCICFFLNSKYSDTVPDNKKAAFRNSIQTMALPLTRSVYFMKS